MIENTTNEIITPHDHDVLSGRGGRTFRHAGNHYFRFLVFQNKVNTLYNIKLIFHSFNELHNIFRIFILQVVNLKR